MFVVGAGNCTAVISSTTNREEGIVAFSLKVGLIMIHAALMALLLVPQTRVVQLPDTEIVRRSNFVIAATLDGFVCYGTKEPLAVRCHRAVRFKEFAELSPSSRVASENRRQYYAAAEGFSQCLLRNVGGRRDAIADWDRLKSRLQRERLFKRRRFEFAQNRTRGPGSPLAADEA